MAADTSELAYFMARGRLSPALNGQVCALPPTLNHFDNAMTLHVSEGGFLSRWGLILPSMP